MKKSVLIPVGIFALGVIVFASGILFPDTASLPRFPSGPGTIGNVLTTVFESDGSSKNTDKLGGVSASGYLHNKDCSINPVNTVWKGVDANGQAICGNVAGLLAIGSFTELYGTVNVWRDGTSGYVPAVLGQDLYPGDLIESDATGTGTIQFAADSSLIRFAQLTDLELQYGNLGGLTVAQVILNDGRLWGRILSSTGVNLGGGGMVTGVRGTSVDIIKNKTTAIYTISVTDSVNTASKIQTISGLSPLILQDLNGLPIVNDTFGGGTQFIYGSGSYTMQKLTANKNTFYADPWFVKNTLSDVAYMSNLLVAPGIAIDVSSKINAELDSTIAANNTGTLYALLTGSTIGTNALSGALLLDQENQIDALENTAEIINKKKALRMNCKRENKTYFPSLSRCDGTWDMLATTDFAGLSGILHGKKDKWNYTVDASSNFDNNIIGRIVTSGNYLQYNGNMASLANKTITIKYTGKPPFDSRNIVYFGPNVGGLKSNLTAMRWHIITATYPVSIVSYDYTNATENYVKFKMPSVAPTQFLIGNDNGYTHPIGVIIASIIIQ